MGEGGVDFGGQLSRRPDQRSHSRLGVDRYLSSQGRLSGHASFARGSCGPSLIVIENGHACGGHVHRPEHLDLRWDVEEDRKSTRLKSRHVAISYAGLCLKKKNK